MSDYFLSLDISTSVIGYCIFYKNEPYEIGCIQYKKSNKEMDLFDKAEVFKKKFIQLNDEYEFDKVFIEAPVKGFTFSKSNSNTIQSLLVFNNLLQYIIFLVASKKPEMVNVNKARKISKIKDKKTALQEMKNRYWLLRWSGTNKDYDMADAVVVGLSKTI